MKIDVDGAKIAFESAGAGPALLFLHAFPLSSAMWRAQLAAIPGRRLIAMDARGFGGSDASAGPLTMERIASDAAAVLDHAGIGDAVVCGCSMGGYAAFSFARLFPARVRALVLVDTRAAPDTDEARRGRRSLADRVLAEGPSVLADAMLPKLLGPTSQRERPALVAQVREWVWGAAPPAVANALRGLGERPDARPTLSQIRVPCLVLRGEEDPVSSEADHAEMLRGIAGSEAVTIPRAGHLASLEAPDVFGEALAAFLRKRGV
jgi:pimeloyl-ACP methyl ester carboxylesterase